MNMKTLTVKIDARIDTGCVRSNNEDNFIVSPNLTQKKWTIDNSDLTLDQTGALLVVADGMGGMNAGEVASQIAVDTVKELFSQLPEDITASTDKITEFLAKVIKDADKAIIEHAKANPDTKGMGTTLILAWILGEDAYIAWCGDSRAYLWEKEMGLRQVSKDHSYVQELVDKGVITSEQAFYHPDSNIITRSLGSEGQRALPEVVKVKLYNESRLFLCSDGLNGMLTDERIAQIIAENPDQKACLTALIEDAKREGGNDNITVVMCDILSGASAYVPEALNDVPPTNPNKGDDKKYKYLALALFVILVGCVSFWFGKKSNSDASEGQEMNGETSEEIIIPIDTLEKENTIVSPEMTPANPTAAPTTKPKEKTDTVVGVSRDIRLNVIPEDTVSKTPGLSILHPEDSLKQKDTTEERISANDEPVIDAGQQPSKEDSEDKLKNAD